MKRVIDKSLCTGCTACFNICPVNAISMKEGSDGFLYAMIDEEKCIKCGLCRKTCPVLNNEVVHYKENIKVLAAYNKDENSRLTASSGGIFDLLAKEVISNNGLVVGCMLDHNKAKHIVIDKEKDIEKLKGSKYIQSEMNTVFNEIKKSLDSKKILFVGTPCQVAGIKAYTKNHENLITCDLVCHGVPSYKSFNEFLNEKLKNEELIEYKFKDKTNSWKNYDVLIKTNNKTILENVNNNEFMIGYLNECYTRDCCFDCHFKGKNRVGDITLGDFWGINNVDPSMDDDKGTSLVVINSEKGLELFNKIKEKTVYKEEDYNLAIKSNSAIVSSPKNDNRIIFQTIKNKKGFIKAANKFKNGKIKRIIKRLLHVK